MPIAVWAAKAPALHTVATFPVDDELRMPDDNWSEAVLAALAGGSMHYPNLRHALWLLPRRQGERCISDRTLTRVLARLVASGLARRAGNGRLRRQRFYELTDAGSAAHGTRRQAPAAGRQRARGASPARAGVSSGAGIPLQVACGELPT